MHQKKTDEFLISGTTVVLAILLFILVFAGVYQFALGYYTKHILHYDYDKLTEICAYPKLYYCDDLRYAAPYCKPAFNELCSKCGNCSLISSG